MDLALDAIATAMRELSQGEDLHHQGDFGAALRRYDAALQSLGQDTDLVASEAGSIRSMILTNKGDCLRNLHRYDEAAAVLGAALKIDPRREAAWFNKGLCLVEQRRWSEAEQCFDRAARARVDPDDELGVERMAEAWEAKARCLAEMGRAKEAGEARARATQLRRGASSPLDNNVVKSTLLLTAFIVGAGVGWGLWGFIGLGIGALGGLFLIALVIALFAPKRD
jgi:tetratricopeptide (TPR) repeat protein